MDEFKYIANEAWKGMMELPAEPIVKQEKKDNNIFKSIFGRDKRQYEQGGGSSRGNSGPSGGNFGGSTGGFGGASGSGSPKCGKSKIS